MSPWREEYLLSLITSGQMPCSTWHQQKQGPHKALILKAYAAYLYIQILLLRIKPCKVAQNIIVYYNLKCAHERVKTPLLIPFIHKAYAYIQSKKIYISYLLFSLKPFIFANNILNIRSRCSQVNSAMSTFPWIPVHRSASLRSSKTLFVLLSNWRKVLTRGKSPWPACASSMRCW